LIAHVISTTRPYHLSLQYHVAVRRLVADSLAAWPRQGSTVTPGFDKMTPAPHGRGGWGGEAWGGRNERTG